MEDVNPLSRTFRVELAGPKQAELVLRLAIAAFEEFRDSLEPPPGVLSETVQDVAAAIARGGAIIAWQGQTAVGSAQFHPEEAFLYIGRVAVPPGFRRMGVASVMMRFLEAHARALGFTDCRVEVRQALPANIALYETLGYVPISVQPHPRVPTAMTVSMARKLM